MAWVFDRAISPDRRANSVAIDNSMQFLSPYLSAFVAAACLARWGLRDRAQAPAPSNATMEIAGRARKIIPESGKVSSAFALSSRAAPGTISVTSKQQPPSRRRTS